ncbi:MAG: GNAT family N-acetyltransferase [Streptococcaceae bacterium]|nr:GNAT family N-acetyltransferase [Streptococcaceae bacterium]
MEIKITRDTMSDIYFDALRIRNQVFVKEQGVPYELEVENPVEEASAVHFVLYIDGKAYGTVRLLADLDKKSGLIQRMAILKEGRGKGYANVLLCQLTEFAKSSNIDILELHAQLSARGLYAKHGFSEVGQVFEEAGIQHITMEKALC